MSGGYTYTTIVTRREEPARIIVSFYLDADAWITVPGIGTGQPHMTIAHGDVSVRIGPRTDEVTAEDAQIARNLADQAAIYAAEVERLAASNTADGTTEA